MRAVKCPVCNGSGQVTTIIPDGTSLKQDGSTTTCHGCNGKGWVEIGGGDSGSYVPCTPTWPYTPTYPFYPQITYFTCGTSGTGGPV